MARVSKAEQQQKFQSYINDVRESRSQAEANWIENVEWLDGQFGENYLPADDNVNVNIISSTVRTMIPNLYFRDPRAVCRPKNPQSVDTAPVAQALLNHYVRDMRLKKCVKRLLVDALCFPFGVAKTGFIMEEENYEIIIDDRTGEVVAEDASIDHPMAYHSVQMETRRIGNRPCVDRVSPRAYFRDRWAVTLDESWWAAEEIVEHIDIVKDEYENTRNLQPSVRYEKSSQRTRTEIYGPARHSRPQGGSGLGPYAEDRFSQRGHALDDLVVLYEFWDKHTMKVYTFAEGHEGFLRVTDWPYAHKDFPYHELNLMISVPDQPYPKPLVSLIKPQQREINKARTYQLAFSKRSLPKVGVDRRRVDSTTLAQLRLGRVLNIVETKGPPNEAIQPLQGPTLNPETHVLENKSREDIATMTGMYMGGAYRNADTATESRNQRQDFTTVMDDLRDETLDFVGDVMGATLKNCQQNLDRASIIEIVGPQGVEWKEYSKRDIQGDFAIEIHAGTQLKRDEATEIKQAENALNITLPIALQGGPVNIIPLLKEYYQKVGYQNVDEIVVESPMDREPTDPHDEEDIFRVGGKPKISWHDDDQQHLAVHTANLQKAVHSEDPVRDVHARLMHIREHNQQMQQKLEAQMLQQMQALAGAQQQGPGAPGQGGAVDGGQGRKAPEGGYPIAPRLMAQEAPKTNETQDRVTSIEEAKS